MSEEDELIEPRRRGRPPKVVTEATHVEHVSDDAPVLPSTYPPAPSAGSGPVWVKMTRRIQMPKHYFAMDLERDPKLDVGDRMLMKPEWAAIMIANGKVVPE